MKNLLSLLIVTLISHLSYSQNILLEANSYFYTISVSTEFGEDSDSGCLHEFHYSGAYISEINGNALSGKKTSHSGYFNSENITIKVYYYRSSTSECEKQSSDEYENVIIENTNWAPITETVVENYTDSKLIIVYKSVYFTDDTPTVK
ncbi:hypothetical protein EI427_23415 [Flammeovirga pectinis]|uniref:Uncharacterized protein n=1 Tax=Flammeovirga pectinis TaxID=2494373 RepID=A0A3Q9FPV7_9BACT|nr:hypothetical protein [Flammeovirga pectinis]AZQ65165.1 hypothetical protein EI427_23415 [Flammeovirga pectinis]